jgi:type VI secretion system secreted protein Hcp
MAFICSAATASAQYEIFIRFTPTNGAPALPGTSVDAKLPGRDGWSLIDGYTLGAQTDAAGIRASFIDLETSGVMTSATPNIFETLASGRSFALVEIAVKRPGDTSAFLNYDLKPVRFTAQNWTGATGAPFPTETLRMNYTALRIRYRPQNSDGSLGTLVTGQWNIVSGTPTF